MNQIDTQLLSCTQQQGNQDNHGGTAYNYKVRKEPTHNPIYKCDRTGSGQRKTGYQGYPVFSQPEQILHAVRRKILQQNEEQVRSNLPLFNIPEVLLTTDQYTFCHIRQGLGRSISDYYQERYIDNRSHPCVRLQHIYYL